MTPLRQKLIDETQLRGFSPNTRDHTCVLSLAEPSAGSPPSMHLSLVSILGSRFNCAFVPATGQKRPVIFHHPHRIGARRNLSDWHYAKGGSEKSSAQVLSMLIALNAASPLITLTCACGSLGLFWAHFRRRGIQTVEPTLVPHSRESAR